MLFLLGESGLPLGGLVDIRLDAHGAQVGGADCDGAGRVLGALALVDGEDAHDGAPRAGHNAVCEVSVG